MKCKIKMKSGFSNVEIEGFKLTSEDGEVEESLTKDQIKALEDTESVDITVEEKSKKKLSSSFDKLMGDSEE